MALRLPALLDANAPWGPLLPSLRTSSSTTFLTPPSLRETSSVRWLTGLLRPRTVRTRSEPSSARTSETPTMPTEPLPLPSSPTRMLRSCHLSPWLTTPRTPTSPEELPPFSRLEEVLPRWLFRWTRRFPARRPIPESTRPGTRWWPARPQPSIW